MLNHLLMTTQLMGEKEHPFKNSRNQFGLIIEKYQIEIRALHQ